MQLVQRPRICQSVGRLGVLCGLFAAVSAYATPLPPGGSVTPDSVNEPGTVLADQGIDFELRSSPGNALLFKGQLQNRVLRLDSNGRLSFGYRIISKQAGLNGSVSGFDTATFANSTTDVSWDPTSSGSIAPYLATRTADGAHVVVSFPSTNPVRSSNADSRFIYIDTDAEYFTTGGTTKLLPGIDGGAAVTLATYRPLKDNTPPVVAITSPNPLECVCNPVKITGTANDPDGFGHYTLEYSVNPGGPWTLILNSPTPVVNGTLGLWNTTGLPQGYYFIRLTAYNGTDLSSSVTTIVYVDQQFDTVDLRSPGDGAILGGWVCFDGTVNDGNGNCAISYTVDYAPGGGVFKPVDSSKPTYPGAVINDPLAAWNTRDGIADGNYLVRVIGTDGCGHSKSVTHKVIVDNTPPVGIITDPQNCTVVNGPVTIRGTAFDAHLAGWTLQYTGGDAHGWVTIASGNTNVVDNVLAVWNTSGLRRCAYTIRLLVADQAGVDCSGHTNEAEYLVSVYLGPQGRFDTDGDGDVDMIDFAAFQLCFSGPAIPAQAGCLN